MDAETELVIAVDIARRLAISSQRVNVLASSPGFPRPLGRLGRSAAFLFFPFKSVHHRCITRSRIMLHVAYEWAVACSRFARRDVNRDGLSRLACATSVAPTVICYVGAAS